MDVDIYVPRLHVDIVVGARVKVGRTSNFDVETPFVLRAIDVPFATDRARRNHSQ
jgi:hypothetical protein